MKTKRYQYLSNSLIICLSIFVFSCSEEVTEHNDNFQALNLIKDKYDSNIQSIYIDPPYNTNASEIIYKNGFKHSSWLSLLDSRFDLTKKLMNKEELAKLLSQPTQL